MEYYIALRDGSKGSDESAANALMELQPYAVIAAEQALARGDFIEAERLRRLLAAADPRAPSLARIASAIARGLLAETQTVRVETPATGDAESLVAAAPASASTTPSTRDEAPAAIPAPSSSAIAAAPVSTAPQVTVAGPVDALTPTPAPIPARQANPAPAQAPSRVALVPVRTPQPEYPADKRQKGAVGQVLASFTVNSDGTVGEVRTESIGSRQVSFERSVAQAVKRWKYQPPGESRSVTQSFSFAP